MQIHIFLLLAENHCEESNKIFQVSYHPVEQNQSDTVKNGVLISSGWGTQLKTQNHSCARSRVLPKGKKTPIFLDASTTTCVKYLLFQRTNQQKNGKNNSNQIANKN